VQAAAEAQRRLATMSLAERGTIVGIIRRVCEERADELARASSTKPVSVGWTPRSPS